MSATVSPQQMGQLGDQAYQQGWKLLRGLLSPDKTVNKGDPRLAAVRDAWEDAANRYQSAGSAQSGAGRAQEYVRAALAYLSLAWLDRLLGEAKASAASALELAELAHAADAEAAKDAGAQWIAERAQTILRADGADGDLAPQWGSRFLDAPSGGGLGWLALLLALGAAAVKARLV